MRGYAANPCGPCTRLPLAAPFPPSFARFLSQHPHPTHRPSIPSTPLINPLHLTKARQTLKRFLLSSDTSPFATPQPSESRKHCQLAQSRSQRETSKGPHPHTQPRITTTQTQSNLLSALVSLSNRRQPTATRAHSSLPRHTRHLHDNKHHTHRHVFQARPVPRLHHDRAQGRRCRSTTRRQGWCPPRTPRCRTRDGRHRCTNWRRSKEHQASENRAHWTSGRSTYVWRQQDHRQQPATGRDRDVD